MKCDNISNTLVLVKTQFGKIIGGFTHYTWNAVHNSYVNDSGKNSFLFSFDLKKKFVPVGGSHLIYCNPAYGPTFGAGCDLFIGDKCNDSVSSYAKLPCTYNVEGQEKFG